MYDFSKYQYTPPLLSCPESKFDNKEDEIGYVQFGQLPTVVFSSHISPLEWLNNKNGNFDNFSCRFCRYSLSTTAFYSCKECLSRFHKECVEPISNHPYHPKHSLRLCHYSTLDDELLKCLFCSDDGTWFYFCSLCDFVMCQNCARKPPVLTIDNPKRHEHTLFYFSRKGSLFCDICSLNDHKSGMYYCSQCEFFVHKDCIYLPYIIRISRHQHRLSFSSLLTPKKWMCGVCRGNIDTKYGRYSCVVEGCNFSVHSKCATREDVWDGKELEGEPEDVLEDVTSIIEISDGVIQHFSHQCHHMRLDKETNTEFDKEKRCHACTLPIYDDIIYKCMQCDFILHEKCAHLPRKKQHPLHPHSLSLQVDSRESWFYCTACNRRSNGFVYKCFEKECEFTLDVCCSSVAEPFDYWYHPHSLFLTHKPNYRQVCSICKTPKTYLITCEECGFDLCFECATLPKKLRYKHDEHFLIHWYDEDATDQYRCEVCETKADPKKDRIYMCGECNVMVHIKCLLGDMDMFMMPGRIIRHGSKTYISIISNNHLTRNICRYCHNRCQGSIIYKVSSGSIFCSFYCMM